MVKESHNDYRSDYVRRVAGAQAIGIGVSKLDDWISRGFVKAFYPEGKGRKKAVFVRLSELENFIATGQPA